MKKTLSDITRRLKTYVENLDEYKSLNIREPSEIPACGKPAVASPFAEASAGKGAMADKPAEAAVAETGCGRAEIREEKAVFRVSKSGDASGGKSAEAAVAEKSASSKPQRRASGKREKKAEDLEELRGEVLKCRRCQLGLSRLNAVFGCGSSDAGVMFVGEGPGFNEDHEGEPFVGRAGRLLDKILASIGFSRETVYITNIVKCHPMVNPENPEARGNDRPPRPDEISACRGYLERQIKIISPGCIVTLGGVASKILLGSERGISSLRGKWHDFHGDLFLRSKIKIFPTYHPAALLRNPSLKRDAWEDMKVLKKFMAK